MPASSPGGEGISTCESEATSSRWDGIACLGHDSGHGGWGEVFRRRLLKKQTPNEIGGRGVGQTAGFLRETPYVLPWPETSKELLFYSRGHRRVTNVENHGLRHHGQISPCLVTVVRCQPPVRHLVQAPRVFLQLGHPLHARLS